MTVPSDKRSDGAEENKANTKDDAGGDNKKEKKESSEVKEKEENEEKEETKQLGMLGVSYARSAPIIVEGLKELYALHTQQMTAVMQRLDNLERQNRAMRLDNQDLVARLDNSRLDNQELLTRLDNLERENAQLRIEVNAHNDYQACEDRQIGCKSVPRNKKGELVCGRKPVGPVFCLPDTMRDD